MHIQEINIKNQNQGYNFPFDNVVKVKKLVTKNILIHEKIY